MFEQTFKNIDDILFKDSGADSELDYIGQTSWIMFLRYLDALELDKADEAELEGKEYSFIIEPEFRWNAWAMPKDSTGKLDHHVALTGKDLVEFVDGKLFPYMSSFKERTDNPQTIEYKIGEIFSELKNKIQSGYGLREILSLADSLPFRSHKDKHELSHLYETKIKNMGNAGRNGGQYYTPRPLIRAMIEVTKPQIGETVYDGAVGSAGFLCESYDYIKANMEQNVDNLNTLQKDTFYGKEKKNLAYVIGIMNMILHGIESPNISKTNTLTKDIRGLEEKDRFDCILANPPFGGKENDSIQQNFPIKSNATELLFLQHMMNYLKLGGKCGVVIPEGVLFQTNNAFTSVKKELLERFNVHTVLSLPAGIFLPYSGVKTNVIFFDRNGSTSDIFYYEVNPPYKLTKNKPIQYEHFKEFLDVWEKRELTDNSWIVNINDIKEFDISAKNPNNVEVIEHKSPLELVENIKGNNEEINDLMNEVEAILMGKDIV